MFGKLGRLLFSFRGRIPRSSFWWTTLALGVVFVVLLVFFETTLGRQSSLALYPPFFWIAAALAIRRMRDRGRHPGWFLALLIPVIGPLWIIFELGFRRGTPGENQYGQDPLEIGTDYLTVKY